MVAGQIDIVKDNKLRLISMMQGDKSSGSCNDCESGTIYYVQTSVGDLPITSAGLVITLGTIANYRLQIYIKSLSPFDLYYRTYIFSQWQKWTQM